MKSPDKGKQTDWCFLTLVIAVAAIVRLDFLAANDFVLDADEAIVGLMGKHILEGRALPVFYYGQHYMGSFEAILAAGFFKLFGISNVVLKMVPFCFSLVLVYVLYELGLQAGGRLAARLAALFCAIPSSALVTWSAMARGGYIEVIVLGAYAMLLMCWWLRAEMISIQRGFFIWLVIGFGWWVYNQIIYFALPVGLFMLARVLRPGEDWGWRALGWYKWFKLSVGVFFTVAGGFLLGGLPFWIYNLQHGFVSFELFGRASLAEAWSHLVNSLTLAIPILLGAKRFWQSADIFPYAGVMVWLVYGLMFLYLLYWRRRRLLNLLVFKIDRVKPVELFLVTLLVTMVVFIASRFGSLVEAPRYLLPVYVPLFVLLGAVIENLKRYKLVSRGATAVVLAFNLLSCYLYGRALPGEPFVFKGERVSHDHSELIKWLDENKVSWIRTNYWIGYRLAFETQERVRFLINQPPFQTRIESYRLEGSKLNPDAMPLVLVPAQGKIIKEALEVLGYSYNEIGLSGYTVLYGIKPLQSASRVVDAASIKVAASSHSEAATLAVDGNLLTRWGSARPQTPGMEFTLTLEPAQMVRGLFYDLGNWIHDYPRVLDIELELESGERRRLLPSSRWESIRYFLQAESELAVYFQPALVRRVVLRQEGSDPVFDWSIAEIKLLQ